MTNKIAAPVYVADDVSYSTAEILFELSKYPEKFTDKIGEFCGSFDKDASLYWNSKFSAFSGLVQSQHPSKRYLIAGSNKYLLGRELTLLHCSEPVIPENLCPNDLEITKVDLNSLVS